MWISDEKTVNLVQGRSSSVTLTLYKNGRAKVTVEFADQDGGTDARPTGSVDGGGAIRRLGSGERTWKRQRGRHASLPLREPSTRLRSRRE
jgi:hypothetical protein